jgi:hypothetical protein
MAERREGVAFAEEKAEGDGDGKGTTPKRPSSLSKVKSALFNRNATRPKGTSSFLLSLSFAHSLFLSHPDLFFLFTISHFLA